jgi:FlaA1/EpsC-like NDP-sugar epimerase
MGYVLIKENQKALNTGNVLTDGVVVILSMMIAYALRFYVFHGVVDHTPFLHYFLAGVIITPFFLFLFALFGLYDSFRTKRFQYELQQIIKSELLGTVILIALFFVFKRIDISRWSLVFFFIVSTLGIALKRITLRKILKRYRSQGRNLKHVLLVGSGSGTLRFYNAVKENSSLGLHVAGQVCAHRPLPGLMRFGGFCDLESVINGFCFDEVVCALDVDEYCHMQQVIQACEKSGTRLSIIPFYYEFMPPNPSFDEVDGVPLLI